MENEILNGIKKIRKECAKKDAKLRKDFESLTDSEKREAVKAEIKSNRAIYDEALLDQENYSALAKKVAELEKKGDQKEYYSACIDLINLEEALCKKYNIAKAEKIETPVINDEEELEEVVGVTKPNVKKQKNKNGVIVWTLIGSLALGSVAGYLAGSFSKCNKGTGNTATVVESERGNGPQNKKEEEKPFEVYGKFTDASDEKQLRERAEWFYNTYIANANKSQAGAKFYTVEDIMNLMRVVNGEFMRDGSGNIVYNDTDLIAAANDLHTIANYDSFIQYGTQIYFTPLAPLFEDGSLAQKGAVDLDKAMAKVVAAIRANDDEAFVAAAKEWGTVVINMFNYVDYTGEYVNVYQVGAPSSFALYHAMSAKYASTILEYSEAHHLNICIPYCIDYQTGQMYEEALSQIMYNLNERAIDAVAVRSGNLAEYEQNNLSLPEDLYLLAKDYFNSKYNLGAGNTLRLK